MAPLTAGCLEALAPATRRALEGLAASSLARQAYLAGSAALALHLGHRPVSGLDLMSEANHLGSPERRDLLLELLDLEPATRVETARDGYLFARFGEVPIKLFYYPYPLVAPTETGAGFPVASALDLGLMKIAAIISRGTRRDFVDLYSLCRELPLEALLARSPEKFPHVRDFPLQALKGLADLSLLGGEPMPRLTEPLAWPEVEAWLTTEVRRLGRQRVGLAG